MQRLLLMLLVAGVSLGAIAAAPTSVRFSGSVREASATPVRFDVAVPVEQYATLVLDDGTKPGLFTPGSPAPAQEPSCTNP